jgi:hypothetical protein
MKKLLMLILMSFSFSVSAKVQFITVEQDHSVLVTVVSVDGVNPTLIDTGSNNIKRVIKVVKFYRMFKVQVIVSHTEFACLEGLERSLWARDGDTNDLVATVQPWSRVSG